MKRVPIADAARAALHALGALPGDQRAAFEERLRTSPALRSEVEALRAAAAELLLAPEPVEPSARVRERLLARVASEAAGATPGLPDMMFALRADEVWTPLFPGIERRELARSAEGSTYLLRIAPGATIPDHGHRRVEHTYVLSGSIEVAGTLCHVGDYHRAAAGTAHQAFRSSEGCVILLIEGSA
jgi:anti-sigma factor ChrR (cupin superfamily)